MVDPFTRADGELHWLGRALSPLAASLDSPVFLFSAERLRQNLHSLRQAFEETGTRTVVRYCAKTNYELGILRVLAGLEVECLVSHQAEARLALQAGFRAERLVFQRPVLLEDELVAILDLGIQTLHVQRPAEVERLARCIGMVGSEGIRVSLRLVPPRGISPLRGLGARVGLTAAQALEIARRLPPKVHVGAVNVYLGTQQSNPRLFARALREVVGVARRLRDAGQPLDEINLGGGIPSPGLERLSLRSLWRRWWDLPHGFAADRSAFAREVARTYCKRCLEAGLDPPPRLAIEAGRSLAGDAGLLLATVLEVDGGWVFTDASSNYLGESKLLFRRPILLLRGAGREGTRRVHVSGSTLNTMDVLDLRRRLPLLRPGDRLVFAEAGAYSLSRARRYAGVTPAAYLLDTDGSVRALRRQEGVVHLAGAMVDPWR